MVIYGGVTVGDLRLIRRKRDISNPEYWHSILNPYTSKPRFRNFLSNGNNAVDSALRTIYRG